MSLMIAALFDLRKLMLPFSLYCYISALINHIRTFLGKEKLVEFVCYTFMAFRLADCCVYA